jgi:hypothetical protein
MKPALLVVGLSLLLLACSKSGPCGGNDLLVDIPGNHGHTKRIGAAALGRRTGSYKLEGGSHEHSLRLDEATLAKLASGDSVTLRSSSQNGHVHALSLTCER